MVGAMLGYMKQDYLLDSRVECKGNGDGTMTAEAIAKSLDRTLAIMGVNKFNILYCECPNNKTPITDQAAAIDKEYRVGKFALFGVCNLPLSLLDEWLQVYDQHNYVKPSVFLGQYNLLCRSYEETHIPFFRKHDIRFMAHSPIAGGFFTGMVTFANDPTVLKDTRWKDSPSNMYGKAYIANYDKPAMHDAVRAMDQLCKAHDTSMFDAAIRWTFYHSALEGSPILGEKGDGVFMGAHNLVSLRKYADAYIAGPLEEELVNGLNKLWDSVKQDSSPLLAW